MTTREIIAAIIDTFEGPLFTEDPVDTGGATKYGITLRTLRAYRAGKAGNPFVLVTKADVKALERDEAIEIGLAFFAEQSGLQEIDDWRLRFAALDYAFHSGWVPAIRAIQRAVGVTVDGIFGPVTEQRTNTSDPRDIGLQITVARSRLMLDLIQRKPEQKRFAVGWWARVTRSQEILAGPE